jgi:hypothetical protein
VTQHTPPGKTDFAGSAERRCNRPVSSPSSGQPEVPAPVSSTYSLAPALRARLLGTGLVAVGLVVLGGILLTWAVDLPVAFVTGLVLLAGVGVLTLGVLLGLRHWVLRIDEHGYRVRVLRSPGSAEGSTEARTARWSDVLDLRTTTLSGQRCVELRLRDGRTTTLPVDLLEGDSTALVETLTAHLDRGHGYRRLR